MRLFTAIDPPEEILLRLERLLTALRPETLIKWSPVSNLHITTKFIGEWSPDRLEELHQALSEVPRPRAFEIQLRDFGWFPNERRPHVLYCGVDGGEPLRKLARDIEHVLERLGIAREEREYTPHLTLARINEAVPLHMLRRKIEEAKPVRIGAFTASHFLLYESKPGSNASRYLKLREYALEPAAAAGTV